MKNRNVVAIGASAGGIESLSNIITILPGDIPASIFIVLHTAIGSSGLDRIFARVGSLEAKYAENRERFKKGVIYIAPPDFHMLLKQDEIHLTRGPRENRARPAIDVLFRSAAAAHDSRLIAVVLSGMLDDGSSGLYAVKECGGITCVQDPNDALYPDMPANALRNISADYVLPSKKIGYMLNEIVREPVMKRDQHIPDNVIREAEISEHARSNIALMEELGEKTPFICPDCGGGLWQIKKSPVLRFRCNTGHAFSIHSLLASQNDMLERALWASVRSLEERAHMLINLAQKSRNDKLYRQWLGDAEDSRKNAQHIRDLLLGSMFNQPRKKRIKKMIAAKTKN